MKSLPFKLHPILGASFALCTIAAIPMTRAQTSATTEPQTAATAPAVATSPVAAPSGQPSEADMMKMMVEMGKTGPNHKLLADTAGSWNYTVKMWMNPDPNAKPMESKGTATRKMIMDGHYLSGDYMGKMEMPGADGKMKTMPFHGVGVEGYDNARKKFVSSWMDSMGTGIMYSEGTWDDATKAWTYTADMVPFPGVTVPVREVITVPDKDHMKLEWYEKSNGQEKKTMQIDYTRAGKGK